MQVKTLISIICLFSQLAHPVLESLKGTPHGWLIELLYAFNSGMFYPFNTISYSLHNAALQLSS